MLVKLHLNVAREVICKFIVSPTFLSLSANIICYVKVLNCKVDFKQGILLPIEICCLRANVICQRSLEELYRTNLTQSVIFPYFLFILIYPYKNNNKKTRVIICGSRTLKKKVR